MTKTESTTNAPSNENTDPPVWTYPTRFCRICREDVPATVTMYPPGIPMQFQTPIVEYKNEDEYGRLLKPCMCRGSSRFIHELCLLRSRTENNRKESMWKCHECGHQFSFQKLRIQRYLNSKISAAFLTIFFMICLMFVLGFIADPIINICLDPYDSLMDYESIWDELEVRPARESQLSAWTQHFAKGFISMGLMGFVKTLLVNPLYWLNIRWGGGITTRSSHTGRDRAVNIQLFALALGVCSAFALFYRWVQAIMQRMLVRIGNNIVDTKLPGDDDDLKPPAGWKDQTSATASTTPAPEVQPVSVDSQTAEASRFKKQGPEANQEAPQANNEASASSESNSEESTRISTPQESSTPVMSGSWVEIDSSASGSDQQPLAGVHRQAWSFSNL